MRAAKVGRLAIGLSMGLLLAACSPGPSGGDIEAAIKKRLLPASDAASKLGGEAAASLVPKLVSAKKQSCTELKEIKDRTVFLCDVEIVMDSPLTGEVKKVEKIPLAKGSDGWVIMAR